MATPYLQQIVDRVPSTQDLARRGIRNLPLVVIAPGQSQGRGRSGSAWKDADRALAVSVAWNASDSDERPLSLMAGLAATRTLGEETRLKWPNDVMVGPDKVGGILVEMADGVIVAGLGLNLYWRDPVDRAGGLFPDDPGPDAVNQAGALWAAEFLGLVAEEGWPIDEYRSACATIGAEIVWDPGGSGRVVDVSDSGGLLVQTAGGVEELVAGAVRHLR